MESRPMIKHKNFFTRAEVAQLFEVAPNTVNRWVLAGRLPSVITPGGRRRYPAGAIMLMLDEQLQAARAYSPLAVQQIGTRRQNTTAPPPARAPLPRQTPARRLARTRSG